MPAESKKTQLTERPALAQRAENAKALKLQQLLSKYDRLKSDLRHERRRLKGTRDRRHSPSDHKTEHNKDQLSSHSPQSNRRTFRTAKSDSHYDDDTDDSRRSGSKERTSTDTMNPSPLVPPYPCPQPLPYPLTNPQGKFTQMPEESHYQFDHASISSSPTASQSNPPQTQLNGRPKSPYKSSKSDAGRKKKRCMENRRQ